MPGSAAKVVVHLPVAERAVEQPRVVDRGIADPRVSPVDHAGEPAVADEQMRRAEIGVRESRLEPGQRLDLLQKGFARRALSAVQQRQDDAAELVALLAILGEPVGPRGGDPRRRRSRAERRGKRGLRRSPRPRAARLG